MKNVLFIILLLYSDKCFSQVLEMPISPPINTRTAPLNAIIMNKLDSNFVERYSKIRVWPKQKVKFDISVLKVNHQVFICDTTGSVLYSQKRGTGIYRFTTGSEFKDVIIYDLIDNKTKNVVGYNPIDDFHRNVGFGGKITDALVKISAIRQ